MQRVKNTIIRWLVNKKIDTNTNGFVVGVSGGIDSAVASTLCAQTGFYTLVVNMPIHMGNHNASTRIALKHINWLRAKHPKAHHMDFHLTNTYHAMRQSIPGIKPRVNWLAMANMQARLRMTALYTLANTYNLLVCGTGNKVEDFGIGFFTKYGDGGVDISPIGDLYKSDVYKLAKHLDIIKAIQKSEPSDGLWEDGRTDESQIGATYDELEWAMKFVKKHRFDLDEVSGNLTERQRKVLVIYQYLNKANKHKMEEIPVCKMRGKYKDLLGRRDL